MSYQSVILILREAQGRTCFRVTSVRTDVHESRSSARYARIRMTNGYG